MVTQSNSINAGQQGVQYFNGTATFSGIDGSTAGKVLTSNGTLVAPSFQAATPMPSATLVSVDDFIGVSYVSSASSVYGVESWFVSGTGMNVEGGQTSAHPGVLMFPSGNIASGNSGIFLGNNSGAISQNIVLGGGALTVNWVIETETLSTVTDRYSFRVGLGDTAAADQVNGVYFEYSDNLNSGQWVGKTASASSRNSSNSNVAAVNNAYVNLGISINAAASSVTFSINGVAISGGPIAATIPTAAITPFFDVTRVSGTVLANAVRADLYYLSQTLTTPR